jgi:hypothetical protein
MNRVRSGQTVFFAILVALAAMLLGAVILNSRPASGAAGPVISMAASVPAGDTLTVVGQGSATAVPDQAIVVLGVSASRGSVADSLSVATDEMTRLIDSLHGQGVQDKDIQTTGINVNQDSSCCPRSVSGYSSSSQVTVLVHHPGNAGSVITAAVGAVGNDIQLNGVQLTVSDASAATKTARSVAMADAGARAGQWAALSGRHLGKIIAVSETVFPTQYGGGCAGCGGGGGGGIPVMPGQSNIALSITVEYELLA